MTDPGNKEAFVEELTQAVQNQLPPLGEDLRKCLKTALNSVFSRMELVTREEFDIQVRLLTRTRERLEEIQQRLEQME